MKRLIIFHHYEETTELCLITKDFDSFKAHLENYGDRDVFAGNSREEWENAILPDLIKYGEHNDCGYVIVAEFVDITDETKAYIW